MILAVTDALIYVSLEKKLRRIFTKLPVNLYC